MRVVVALGGNALLHGSEPPEEATQTARLAGAASEIAKLASLHELVIVHGNGPQVGLLAKENAADRDIHRPYPLGDMVAESQGLIGLWIQEALHNAGLTRQVVTVVTQTVVQRDDPAWAAPSKFVGSRMSKSSASRLAHEHGWTFAEDGAGFRRTVASPAPVRFLEQQSIEALLDAGCTVIAAGGGGVPVLLDDGKLQPAEAVVDKDLAASLLAIQLDAELFVILTDVPNVEVDHGTERAAALGVTTAQELSRFSFPPGTMGPKVAAAINFTNHTGRRSAIGALADVRGVVTGRSGTQLERPIDEAVVRASTLA